MLDDDSWVGGSSHSSTYQQLTTLVTKFQWSIPAFAEECSYIKGDILYTQKKKIFFPKLLQIPNFTTLSYKYKMMQESGPEMQERKNIIFQEVSPHLYPLSVTIGVGILPKM